jgi:hypothetical protein
LASKKELGLDSCNGAALSHSALHGSTVIGAALLLASKKGFQDWSAIGHERIPELDSCCVVHWTSVCYWQHSKDSRVGQLFLSSPARYRKSSRRTKKSSLKNKEQFQQFQGKIVLNLIEAAVKMKMKIHNAGFTNSKQPYLQTLYATS